MTSDNDIILTEVKRMLEIEQETTEFDIDITSHVNSAFFSLFEIGVGPSTPFYINASTTWGEFETIIPKSIILDYLYLKTKMVFDPPASSSVIDAFKDRLSELEFRMNVYTDSGGGDVSG